MDIRIEGDPTSWTLARPVDASQLAASGEPMVVPVSEPLAGRLLLSPRSVGSVVFFQPAMDPHKGVVPNGVRLPEQCLYVPFDDGPGPAQQARPVLPASHRDEPDRAGDRDQGRDEPRHHGQH